MSAEQAGTQQPRGRAKANLRSGIIWNLGSLAFLAAAGFILNVIIGRIYGPEALGVFNISYSIFIFCAQIASFGLHFSVLQTVSRLADGDQAELDAAAISGLWTTAVIALAVTLVAIACTPLFGRIFQSVEHLEAAWLALAPALLPLSINKTLMNIVNGANHMRTFAVLQSARYVAMMISLIVFMSAGWPSHLLAVIITISEFSLLLLTIPCANRVVSLLSQFHKGWARRHVSFGLRGAFAGAVTELNTRIDVIVIGAIMSERWAGIYSVALLAFEGASQVIVAIRYNLNPRLTKFVTEHAVDDFRSFARRVIFMMTLLMFAVSAAAAIAYPFFVEWIMGDASYMAAFPALCIMLAAQTVTSGFVAMNMLLIQGNKPGAQSMYMVLVLAANLFGNILLVPIYGMSGAAIATGISFFVSAVALAVLARKHFGLSFL